MSLLPWPAPGPVLPPPDLSHLPLPCFLGPPGSDMRHLRGLISPSWLALESSPSVHSENVVSLPDGHAVFCPGPGTQRVLQRCSSADCGPHDPGFTGSSALGAIGRLPPLPDLARLGTKISPLLAVVSPPAPSPGVLVSLEGSLAGARAAPAPSMQKPSGNSHEEGAPLEPLVLGLRPWAELLRSQWLSHPGALREKGLAPGVSALPLWTLNSCGGRGLNLSSGFRGPQDRAPGPIPKPQLSAERPPGPLPPCLGIGTCFSVLAPSGVISELQWAPASLGRAPTSVRQPGPLGCAVGGCPEAWRGLQGWSLSVFQTVHDGRQFLKYIDPKLGVPLPERDYGGNCLIYDPDNETDPFHNIWDKLDGFVPAHFLGWYLKTLMIRDWWMCMIISVMFEFLEYSLEHQLPNFSECWWDHWIMDVLLCNGLGIYCGMKTLGWLSLKTYKWQGLWNIPTYKGKMKRIAFQFTPYSWVRFEWKPASNLRRWLGVCGIILVFLLAELNTFYLKFVLWMPPEHYLVLLRLVFFVNVGGVAMREIYDFMDDPKSHKKFGQQAWLVAAITATEFLIVVKYDPYTLTLSLPFYVAQCWVLGTVLILTWTVWRFFLRDITLRYKEIRRQKQESRGELDRAATNGSEGSSPLLEEQDRDGQL